MSKERDVDQKSLGREVSNLLSVQTQKVQHLSRDLARSYEKELQFFENLEERDRQLRDQERRYLKKIWWLESERRRLLEQNRQLRRSASWGPGRVRDALFRARRWAWHARKAVQTWR
nr:hypothetical protein [Kocuria rhizophila]